MSPHGTLPFFVQVSAQGVQVSLRAMYRGGEQALGEYPGTWVGVFCGPVDGLRQLALWLELPDELSKTFRRDRDFELDLLERAALQALSRDWMDLAPLGWMRWAGSWSLTFRGTLAVPAPLGTEPPSWLSPDEPVSVAPALETTP